MFATNTHKDATGGKLFVIASKTEYKAYKHPQNLLSSLRERKRQRERESILWTETRNVTLTIRNSTANKLMCDHKFV